MELNNMLNELIDKDDRTLRRSTSSDDAEKTSENDSVFISGDEGKKEGLRVLIDSDSSFKGRISKPIAISFKYKELAVALSDASGLSINRKKAKAMFSAFRNLAGL